MTAAMVSGTATSRACILISRAPCGPTEVASVGSNGDVATLTDKEGAAMPSVHWVIQDDLRSFWLGTSCVPCALMSKNWMAGPGRIRSIHPTISATPTA